MKKFLLIPAALLILLTTACQEQEIDGGSVTGTINYRERIALSDEAVVEIKLVDVSRQDAKALVIAEKTLTRPGQVPISFELDYDPEAIDERMSYAIQVRINDGGKLMFITDRHEPVLTRDAGRHVDLNLVRAQTLVSTPRDTPRQPQQSQQPRRTQLNGTFRYMADAAIFRDCRTDKTFPVAQEAQYLETERAYLKSGVKAGEEIFVQIIGRMLERPKDDGIGNEVKVIIDSLVKMDSRKSCVPEGLAELTGTYWKLVETKGKPFRMRRGMNEPHIIFADSDGLSRVRGNAGCNNFFGEFQVTGDVMIFSGMGSSMKMCPNGMDEERAFLEALEPVNRYRINGMFLELFKDQRSLARFEAIYKR
jgi:uncharacterized lipoprotein YbaY/heat shock protein HslJ